MTTSNNPDEIRAEIERTRYNLSNDVDAMAEKVTPSNVAQRQVDKVRDAVGGAVDNVRDRVMGTADGVGTSVSDTASSAKHGVQSAAQDAGDAARRAPHQVKRKTQGNPLAAGVIALGIGWLAASLLPASQKEQELASRLEESAQPVLDDVKQQARHVAEELKEPAQQAAQQVKESATDSAENVKLEAQIQKDEVTDSAKSNAEDVRKTAQDG